jgi:hypothetical protein
MEVLAGAALRGDVIATPGVLETGVHRLMDVADPMAQELERRQSLLIGRIVRRQHRDMGFERRRSSLRIVGVIPRRRPAMNTRGVAVHYVPAMAAIHVAARRRGAGEALDLGERRRQGLAVVRIAGLALYADHETFAVGDRDLGTELVFLVRLTLGDAGDLGRMQGVELVLVGALLRQQPRVGRAPNASQRMG